MRTSQVTSVLFGAMVSSTLAAPAEVLTPVDASTVVAAPAVTPAPADGESETIIEPFEPTTTIFGTPASAAADTLATYAPIVPADVDGTDPENVVPKKDVKVSYGAAPAPKAASALLFTAASESESTDEGQIDVNFTMSHPAVVLEYVEAVSNVDCTADSVTVSFSDEAMLDQAATSWGADGKPFVIVTNHMGDCDDEFERGFFVVESVAAAADGLSLTCSSIKKEIAEVAESCEMNFNSVPASTLRKRLEVNPSASINFTEGVDPGTVLLSDDIGATLTADKAEFSTTVTFSGYLKYNFLGFKLEDLYFDLNTQLSADLAVSASLNGEYTQSFDYAPSELSFDLVEIPGLIAVGPGVGFSVGVDLEASGAVDAHVSAGVSIPAGTVHLDMLDNANNVVSGWEPQYTSHADVSQSVDLGLDAAATVTVELSVRFLAGLIDLSGGLTATPRFVNSFSLDGTQQADAATGTDASAGINEGVACGLTLKSDFVLDLDAFASSGWNSNLYHLEAPVTDLCYNFEQQQEESS